MRFSLAVEGKRGYLAEDVGGNVLQSLVSLSTTPTPGASLSQQHRVKQVAHILQLSGDVHVLVHAEHLGVLCDGQSLRTKQTIFNHCF